jgi:hypothetical protein
VIGQESGTGFGVERPQTRRSRFVAPGLSWFAAASLTTRTVATLHAQALFPLSRDDFVLNDGLVHRIPAVSFQVALGLGGLLAEP